jgi:hypothetical protein
MTDAQKAAKLREAMELLQDAKQIVNQTLGGTDAGEDTLSLIGNAIEDLMYDVMELES